MTTDKQREANRRNALKSSGPKTALGKARSARNAQTHGIFARHVITSMESKNEFVMLITRLYEQFNPQSMLEEQLVDQLAVAFWRARRLANAERMAIEENKNVWAELGADLFQIDMEKMFLFGRYQVMITNQIKTLLEMIRNEQDLRIKTIDNFTKENVDKEN